MLPFTQNIGPPSPAGVTQPPSNRVWPMTSPGRSGTAASWLAFGDDAIQLDPHAAVVQWVSGNGSERTTVPLDHRRHELHDSDDGVGRE